MVIIFIAYGKKEGEKVGEKVNEYFKKKGYTSFLAAPKSPDVKSGEDFQKDRIDPTLVISNVFLIIITPGLKFSKPAMKEIRYAISKKKTIVPYVRGSTKPPNLLKSKWAPVKFAKKKGGLPSNLKALDFSMWGRIDADTDWSIWKPQSIKETARVRSKKLKRKVMRRKIRN